MDTTWIVVAESSRARIFQTDKAGSVFEELADLVHPNSRLKARELSSDSPGRSFDSKGAGRHAMSQMTDTKRHQGEVFAGEIADKLESGRTKGEFDHLILVAPPEFLGLLRASIGSETANLVSTTVNKNLVRLKPSEIREHLKV